MPRAVATHGTMKFLPYTTQGSLGFWMEMLYCSLKYWMTPMLRSGAPSLPFMMKVISDAGAEEMRLIENWRVDLLICQLTPDDGPVHAHR